MATRKIDTQIARDIQWKEMSIKVRYFWFYLLTTDFSKTIGIFYLPLDIVATETDLDISEIKQYLAKLTELKLLVYSPESSEVVIFNYPKYNIFGWNDFMKKQIMSELSTIKNLNLIKIIIFYLQNYVLTRPNDRRTQYLSKAISCCKKALKPYEKEKEKTIDKDIDVDEDKDVDIDVDEDKDNMNEIIKENNTKDLEWEEVCRIAKVPWLKEDDDE